MESSDGHVIFFFIFDPIFFLLFFLCLALPRTARNMSSGSLCSASCCHVYVRPVCIHMAMWWRNVMEKWTFWVSTTGPLQHFGWSWEETHVSATIGMADRLFIVFMLLVHASNLATFIALMRLLDKVQSFDCLTSLRLCWTQKPEQFPTSENCTTWSHHFISKMLWMWGCAPLSLV